MENTDTPVGGVHVPPCLCVALDDVLHDFRSPIHVESRVCTQTSQVEPQAPLREVLLLSGAPVAGDCSGELQVIHPTELEQRCTMRGHPWTTSNKALLFLFFLFAHPPKRGWMLQATSATSK